MYLSKGGNMDNQPTATQNPPEEVQKLTDQLMTELGIQDLPANEKVEILAKIKDRVNDTILLTLLQNLSSEDAQEVEKKLQAGATDREVLDYLAQYSTKYADKFSEALTNLYNELKSALN